MKERSIYNKSWRKDNPDKYQRHRRICKRRYVKKYPQRRLFANKVYELLRKGIIEKKPCVECKSTKYVQACSLSSVYDPLWLCDKHNKELHARVKGGNT